MTTPVVGNNGKGGWKWYTYALIAFSELQIFVREPKYIYIALLSTVPAIFWFTSGVSRYLVLIPVVLALITAHNERAVTGYIRVAIIKFILQFPPCDPSLDPLLFQKIKKVDIPFNKKKTVLMTGATGFGSVQVLKYLVENYKDWQIIIVSRSKNRAAAMKRIHQVCSEHNIPTFETGSIEVVHGDFKYKNLGRSFEELDAIWKNVGAVFHFAVSNSYIVPPECNYIWNKNLDLLCRLCHKNGSQFHAIGGNGYHLQEDCKIPPSYMRSTWCNGYFMFKRFQRLLVQKYVDHGMIGCCYDLPYIYPDPDQKDVIPPLDYELNLNIKFATHFGQVRSFEVSLITPSVVAKIMAKHMENAYKTGAFEYNYMHIYVAVFDDKTMNRIANAPWAKSREQVEEAIREQTVNHEFLITVFRDIFPEFWVDVKCRPLIAPEWAKEICRSVNGEEVFRNIVSLCDSQGFSLAQFKSAKRNKRVADIRADNVGFYKPS